MGIRVAQTDGHDGRAHFFRIYVISYDRSEGAKACLCKSVQPSAMYIDLPFFGTELAFAVQQWDIHQISLSLWQLVAFR